jgi:hypothetical protein
LRDGGNRTGGIEPEEVREPQRDRQQIELYKQKKQELKNRDREQIEIARKNKDKEKKRSRQLRNSRRYRRTRTLNFRELSASEMSRIWNGWNCFN